MKLTNSFNSRVISNARSWLYRSLLLVLAPILLQGCLLKTAPVSPRHFVLASVSTNEPARPGIGSVPIGIGFVKMPAYLLRDHLAVRNNANEIEYLENALWAERLDQGFQRALSANLSRLLGPDCTKLPGLDSDHEPAKIFVSVQQFDVNSRGRGTLIAQWRIIAPDSNTVLKGGEVGLSRTGASPRGNPQTIATTLSDLTAEFSRDVAQSIREIVKPSP